MRTLTALLAALLVGASPALARSPMPKQQARDEAIVAAAWREMTRSGFPGLTRHLPKLEAILAHAPAEFPSREERDGTVILRGRSEPDGVRNARLSAAGKTAVKVETEFNTYPMAAFMVGAYDIEAGRYAQALPSLDKGLALQPDNPMLVTEKASALHGLKRWAEAAELTGAWLSSNVPAADAEKARVLRTHGFALIELGRLTEAEAAYRAALDLQPEHAGAINELLYIRKLKAGGQAAGTEITTSDKAAAGDFGAPKD